MHERFMVKLSFFLCFFVQYLIQNEEVLRASGEFIKNYGEKIEKQEEFTFSSS